MLTVVIPVYNRAALITRLLDSLYRQTVTNFSVIIVDNDSTDGSYNTVSHWIEHHGDRSINFSQLKETIPGAAAARNCGLAAVTTPLTCFYDSDDTLRPEFVETILRCYEYTGNPDIIIYPRITHYINGKEKATLPVGKSKCDYYKVPDKNIEYTNLISDIDWLREKHFLNCALSTQAYVARTEIFRTVGGWNSSLHYWDDWELGIRLLQLSSLKIASTGSTPLADVYQLENSLTGMNYYSRAALIEDTLQAACKDINGQQYPTLLVDLVRARIAGRIRSEGKSDLAQQLMQGISCKPRLQRLILRIAYLHTRFLRRGAASWAAPLLRRIYNTSTTPDLIYK